MEKINHKDIQDKLWSNDDESNLSNEQYNQLLIEQYRIYVELTDRTSYRRIVINLFFLVFNLVLVGIVALAISNNINVENPPSGILVTIPYFAGLVFCYAWWKIIRFFRHHIQIKNSIVPSLEKRLPSKVWLTEEHIAEQKGSFKPIRILEIYMPFIFMGIYSALFLFVELNWLPHTLN
ncbi:intracellular proliferation membrane protein RipA [Francisella philomiragia]|uniref:intracellular proliferation membrane protein RipA n=1 Tax=Francisella philomiragia TaxID=28110 RepID=UPI0001AF7695|nr:hypothetical protein [Francisella philomiragia]AJI74890.1 hypothetical protein BZ13_1358 [Francisella philomiragia subsp. philomiragia ATCC 25015]EET20451.1 conserved hypothetical protein [Francisella philomiragia subsp. philomiragia ATCC 25015]MBK2237494.1 hypothetical protein [Francisella philomiragia]